MFKAYLVAACMAVGVWAQQASAAVLLDTTAGAAGNPTSWLVANDAPDIQSIGVSFSTGVAVTLTSVTVYLHTVDDHTRSVDVGILADAGGVPDSGAFLAFETLTAPLAAPLTLSVNWSLAAGTYWLAAIGQNDFKGGWRQSSVLGVLAFTPSGGAVNDWTSRDGLALPGALIIAEPQAVPEPGAAALLAVALLGIAWLRQRRTP
jgi:hypothetical protein